MLVQLTITNNLPAHASFGSKANWLTCRPETAYTIVDRAL
jgi:hypothetical protein